MHIQAKQSTSQESQRIPVYFEQKNIEKDLTTEISLFPCQGLDILHGIKTIIQIYVKFITFR